ncbi:unnamed protein product [Rhizoctonia solani]|uniref:Uncharacterized protein n=1 Tax=Rhizoctonia solani TaxID=456999 RepID=A0A8H3HZ69_9AGAM|nr:unnamed protein product [Rhizoctonia solani]
MVFPIANPHTPTNLRVPRNEASEGRNVACVSDCKQDFCRGVAELVEYITGWSYIAVALMADSSRTLAAALARTEMWTQTTAGLLVLLAAVLAAVWRRRRWRRTKPWLAKLRAETASKVEKDKETLRKDRPPLKDTPKESSDKEKKPKPDLVKRTKERRKRGKESKPTRTPLAPATQPSPDDQPHVVPPHLIPLPPSPTITPTLVLSSNSPVSTAFDTEIPPITPTLTLASPASTKPKLPAFPPVSPLPPNLARKPPPVVRKPVPSIDTGTGSLNRKPSYAGEVEFPTLNSFPKEERPKVGRKPSDAGRKDRARKPSEGNKKTATPESTQIASLKGALEAARLREEEVVEERKSWQKKERELQTQINQLSHQLHALTIAFATGGGQGFPPYGYGYGTAVDPTTQPTTPAMKSETTSEAEHIPPPHTAYPATYVPYPQFPVFMVPHGPAMTPQHAPPMAHMPPTPTMSPPPMSPPAPPYLFSQHPWTMHRGGSPMHHGHPINSPGGIPMNHAPGRYPNFYSGSPRRGGSRLPRRPGTGTPSTPSVGSVDDSIALPNMEIYPDTGFGRDISFVPPAKDALSLFGGNDRSFTSHTVFPQPPKDPSVPDTTDDYIPLRDDYIPIPPPPSGTKREREPETDDDDDSSSSESDDDSVIFEDGSVTDSVNLSLRGSERGKGELEVVRIAGEQDTI